MQVKRDIGYLIFLFFADELSNRHEEMLARVEKEKEKKRQERELAFKQQFQEDINTFKNTGHIHSQ